MAQSHQILILIPVSVRREQTALALFQFFQQIAFRLIQFERSRYGIQTTFCRLGKLFIAHLYHVLHIHELYSEKADKGKRHDHSQKPNGRFLHIPL